MAESNVLPSPWSGCCRALARQGSPHVSHSSSLLLRVYTFDAANACLFVSSLTSSLPAAPPLVFPIDFPTMVLTRTALFVLGSGMLHGRSPQPRTRLLSSVFSSKFLEMHHPKAAQQHPPSVHLPPASCGGAGLRGPLALRNLWLLAHQDVFRCCYLLSPATSPLWVSIDGNECRGVLHLACRVPSLAQARRFAAWF